MTAARVWGDTQTTRAGARELGRLQIVAAGHGGGEEASGPGGRWPRLVPDGRAWLCLHLNVVMPMPIIDATPVPALDLCLQASIALYLNLESLDAHG